MPPQTPLRYFYIPRRDHCIGTNSRKSLSCVLSRKQSTRPPNAPKQFPDINHIQHHVGLYQENCRLRNYEVQACHPNEIARLTKRFHEAEKELRYARTAQNSLTAAHKSQTQEGERPRHAGDARELRAKTRDLEESVEELASQSRNLAIDLPNLTSFETQTVVRPGDRPKILDYINYDSSSPPTFPTKDNESHVEIGAYLSLLDFTSSPSTSGWGFYFLRNAAVLLEQALISFALSIAIRHGFTPISPPSLVYTHLTESCGFRPRDENSEQQIWSIAPSPREAAKVDKPARSLSATAEIPLAGMHSGRDIPERLFPLKYVGTSRCYRAEAGARGVDTKGLYRVHEFTKVELFGWSSTPSGTSPDQRAFSTPSMELFDTFLTVQLEILRSLGLPCRVLEMPASDLGASAYRKIDIECLFPSRRARDGGWGEVTSLSNCTDYQARRLGTRILEASGARKKFPQTVNGTALAVPRVLAAILEWGWREDGTGEGYVVVPECLRGWMGGLERIEKSGPEMM